MIRAEVEGSDVIFGVEMLLVDDGGIEAASAGTIGDGTCVASFDSDFFFRVMGKAYTHRLKMNEIGLSPLDQTTLNSTILHATLEY